MVKGHLGKSGQIHRSGDGVNGVADIVAVAPHIFRAQHPKAVGLAGKCRAGVGAVCDLDSGIFYQLGHLIGLPCLVFCAAQ